MLCFSLSLSHVIPQGLLAEERHGRQHQFLLCLCRWEGGHLETDQGLYTVYMWRTHLTYVTLYNLHMHIIMQKCFIACVHSVRNDDFMML